MSADLTIAWVPASSSTIVRLRGIVPPQSVVVPFQDEFALLKALSRDRVILTVVEAGGSTHDLAVRTLRRVHDAFPEHPLVAWCDFKTIRSNELLDVARLGVQDIVRNELDELKFVFARIMASATQRAISVRLAEQLRHDVPAHLHDLLEYSLERADQRLEREAVAAAFGMSRRTLHARLKNAGLPATREFLTWCRMLVASALLDQPGHTLDTVAGQLDFNDGHLLGTTLRRYAGAGINRLRDGGVLDAVLGAFREAIRAGQITNPAPRSLPAPSSAD
jgi:AraC-like DNA-binding protein